MALFGPGQKMTAGVFGWVGGADGGCLYTRLRSLGLCPLRGVRGRGVGVRGRGVLAVGVDAYEETAVCLPGALERLEVVED
jgi:hypothetical protein